MYGKIKQINEIYDKKIGRFDSCEGYEVITDKHNFYVLISEYQCCCEQFGCISSEDDFSLFLEQELLEVNLTDTALEKINVDEEFKYGFDCGDIQFVDFVTKKGVLQLAVYNAHNGYYGHSIYILKDEEKILEDCL